ncbi:hypothetical protein Taro_047127 [Colocasia esculenta]|uniref:Myb/SANT-like DNA-binding domain-containing protein n=1 Tax=Colocasia esculenta TaxID=4460 RepID=A0A843X081_COLES|nr:hypothetical protein [Colocasia esculenta]
MDGKEAAAAAARPPNPALPYREDCWSEGATSTLIDAWGERYLELNRGNLRQKHWQEVADVVNSRRTAVRRPARTDIQCKNRIDTLKKKYKVEKARIASSGVLATSQWPFYERLDALIGPSPFSQKPSLPPPLALPLPCRKSSPLPAAMATARPSSSVKEKRHSLAVPAEDSSFLKRKYSAVAAAAAAASVHKDEEVDSESSKSSTERSTRRGGWRGSNNVGVGSNANDDAEGVRELARAILRFGEIYEKVEAAKQQQMLELEKQRMDFAKGLEFQRMQIFVDSQVQLEKLKRSKRATSG